jgi:hypothetical protein
LTQAEVEAEARRVTKSTDDEEPLEWGTGLKQKQNSADAGLLINLFFFCVRNFIFAFLFMMQPFAQFSSDPSVLSEKRSLDRFGDPLLQLKKVNHFSFYFHSIPDLYILFLSPFIFSDSNFASL